MNVSIEHPTDRPNFTEVTVGEVTIWFSYKTAVEFMAPGYGRVVRRNVWAQTTGKHLNHIDNGRKEARVDGDTFSSLLEDAMAGRVREESLVE